MASSVTPISQNDPAPAYEEMGWRTRLRKGSLIAIAGFFIGITLTVALVVGLFLWTGRTITFSGRVVSDKTGEPVPDALVALESSLPYSWETPGLGEYVRTDSKGRFSARVRGEVSIRVWKAGYAMADESASYSELSRKG